MKSCEISILNALGMHARAAAKFVHTAGSFQAHIRVARGEREVDGKSIMGLLLLAAAQGSTIRISADGADEVQAIASLCALIERGFDETAADAANARPVHKPRAERLENARGEPFDKPQDEPCS
jgi:phosphocarrier protein